MEEIKRIYTLLLHSKGLKIKDIAQKLDLDKYYVAEVMFSSDNNQYWYYNASSLWYAKEGAINIEEPKVDKLTTPLEAPKVINVARYLSGHTSASFRSYLKEIANYRVYSDDEIKELFGRYRNGDQKAFYLIVKSNLRLVLGFAYLLRKEGVQMEDLIQEGNMGLLRAIELYDHTRNSGFINYARNWIFQAITCKIPNLSCMIKYPANQYSLYLKVQKFKEQYEQRNGYLPSDDAIEIDDDYDKIAFINKLPNSLKDIIVLSSDLDLHENNSNPIDKYEDIEYDKFYVTRLLHNLQLREKNIVRLYFGIDVEQQTLNSIGERYRMTRERARQIVSKAIRKLRSLVRANEFCENLISDSVAGYEVKALDVATIGDYVDVLQLNQLGKVVNTTELKDERILYVMGVHDRKIFKITKDGVIKSDESKKKHAKSEKLSPERITFLNSLYGVYGSNYKPEKTNTTYKKHIQHDIQKTQPRVTKPTVPISYSTKYWAKIGDRIIYDKKPCVVLEKKVRQGYTRLVIMYNDGTIDNVPDERKRYKFI